MTSPTTIERNYREQHAVLETLGGLARCLDRRNALS